AGLTLTRMIPAFAVAYWTNAHSAQFGLQMPTRSPGAMPAAMNARPARSTSAANSAYVYRSPWWTDTSASRSPKRATVRSRLPPIVSPSSGVVDVPDAYDGSMRSLLLGPRSRAYRRARRYEAGMGWSGWMRPAASRKRTGTALAGQHVP